MQLSNENKNESANSRLIFKSSNIQIRMKLDTKYPRCKKIFFLIQKTCFVILMTTKSFDIK